MHITKRLRGIRAAWHFWYAVVFGGESGLRKVSLFGTHPLTRRYVNGQWIEQGQFYEMVFSFLARSHKLFFG
ncbi:hypothetical protein VCSRO91_3613 [Vibrio cholerae]|nr:hypothetical protein VCSRO91_3613 [Vibrio cholerae]